MWKKIRFKKIFAVLTLVLCFSLNVQVASATTNNQSTTSAIQYLAEGNAEKEAKVTTTGNEASNNEDKNVRKNINHSFASMMNKYKIVRWIATLVCIASATLLVASIVWAIKNKTEK